MAELEVYRKGDKWQWQRRDGDDTSRSDSSSYGSRGEAITAAREAQEQGDSLWLLRDDDSRHGRLPDFVHAAGSSV